MSQQDNTQAHDRPLGELRESGLLWLINRTVFHPRGIALALVHGEAGEVTGWQLIGDGSEPMWFAPADEHALFAAATATLAAAMADGVQAGAHAIVHRDIGWLADGEEESAELPVCGQCVPKNSHFPSREDVPVGACITPEASIRLDAVGGGTIEVGGHDISSAVRGFTLTSEVGHMPGILLDLLVFTGETEVEGDVKVHVPDETTAALVALGWTPPPRLVKVDGVLTEGDADTAREALRQMNADPHGLKVGMVLRPYTDHGQPKWVFRCWGTKDGCDGMLSLDHTTRTSAESARDRHLAEAHQPADGTLR